MSDYTKQDWKDGTDGGTPITAARLAHIEDGIAGHAHSASDVASGTLSADRLPTVPIAHGGTGATTAAAALTALGAASASELATVRDSVSHMRRLGTVTDFAIGVDGNSQIFIQVVFGDSTKIGITFSKAGTSFVYW